jgi:hypothetical protein
VLRILHFSDVHIQVPLWQMPVLSFLNKRLFGIANLRLRRGKSFHRSPEKIAALFDFAKASQIDFAVFTGDCTALGTEPEYRAARTALEPFINLPNGCFALPGNHDLYIPEAVTDLRFDRYFGDLLYSDMPQLRGQGQWPVIRLVGDSVALIAVNSAKPNPEPWRASGRIPDDQLEALSLALRNEQLTKRFVFVVNHYGPRRKDETPDTSLHGFENGEQFLKTCSALAWGAILHGHIHWHYNLKLDTVLPPIFCAGSATFEGREGFWVFDVDDNSMKAFSGHWTGTRYELDAKATVEMTRT